MKNRRDRILELGEIVKKSSYHGQTGRDDTVWWTEEGAKRMAAHAKGEAEYQERKMIIRDVHKESGLNEALIWNYLKNEIEDVANGKMDMDDLVAMAEDIKKEYRERHERDKQEEERMRRLWDEA